MKKVDSILRMSWIAALLLLTVFLLIQPVGAEAKSQMVAVEGAAYNVNSSLADNLKSFVGKKVYLTLAPGTTMAGIIKEIGVHLVHLEKIDGKEFSDALIRLENIVAIDTLFREYQR